ncbi:DMSO/TMAO reductase YedYZ molybdopterin-dependent catalytic subunit [Agromyces flavus]|uniref:DMSO/TMAO reductase YedYZ molybdopterin-dependent catalytic subunit n=1 Tax=Agromyces flavus TaxID=589382 RepID=A0A1H1YPX2_9MICO|nr:molybdopterin-dependent oxidoreductase [Agromyces flavus]MCP2366765.1 DMSO/TMAO reductase YedYZ molybdopterin-dependent catalytic subunit [Agromyces flavus]GGI45325.1 putative oxidoreductase [Agromyces flavus]SDT23437.1 DMSO/TMAO reductase YedYZ, molybdopterin-dependent catalytic subunit [Agromyces flavus]
MAEPTTNPSDASGATRPVPPRPGDRATSGWAAVSGVIAAGAFLAAAELAAVFTARDASPIVAVGAFVIDVVPPPVKEFVIAAFGVADKAVLLGSLGLAVVIASAIAGVLELRRPPWGAVLLGGAGLLSLAAILTRAGAGALSWVPPVVGTVAGILVLELLVRRLRRARDAAPTHEADGAGTGTVDRRGFFVVAALAAASALVVGIGARASNAASASIDALRGALRLPTPRRTVAIPAGAELDVPGISPLFTPNADFYRIDTALTVPAVDPSSWRLTIDGMVGRRVELSFDELASMGVDEYAVTIACVSNEVGGGLIGNAIWLGVPVRDILALAAPDASADMVLSRSVDGFTASTPLDALTDPGRDAILAVGMNGEPLPLEHGFPVRMIVPGLYGYVSATKWLSELKVTTFAADQGYWTPRGWSPTGPIKLSSRIDTPRSGATVPAGRTAVAGMAWAQHTGIDGVEVRVDDGAWRRAELSTPVNRDTWVQWVLEWDAAPGTYELTVRAVDHDGQVQTGESAPPPPDGATGWHRVRVTVAG